MDTHGTESAQGFWNLLTTEDRYVLRTLGQSRKYRSGMTMCVEGEPATHLFIIVDGWVKVFSVTDDGHEITLALRGGGDVVGEAAGEIAGRRSATMQAMETVDALVVGYERFSSFLDTHPSANRAYRRAMALRYSDADMMLRRRTAMSGAQRLASLLLELAGRHGSQADFGIELSLPLSQEELASLVGTSRATVARALSNWRKRGFIRTGPRRIALIDLPALRRVAGPGWGT